MPPPPGMVMEMPPPDYSVPPPGMTAVPHVFPSKYKVDSARPCSTVGRESDC